MPSFTLSEVAAHNTKEDLWMIIDGKVVDVTKFCDEHPGGEEVLIEQGGLDATEAFEDVGHSDEAREMLKNYYVGEFAGKAPKPAAKASTPSSTPKSGDAGATDMSKFLLPVAAVVALIVYKYFM